MIKKLTLILLTFVLISQTVIPAAFADEYELLDLQEERLDIISSGTTETAPPQSHLK